MKTKTEYFPAIPKGFCLVGGILFPMSQLEEAITAWFKGEQLPTPKRP
jgi:hypothetical protein